MKYILDTHILLWWLDDDNSLTSKFRSVISNPDNMIFISAVSIWEIEIKKSLKKLKAPIIDTTVIDDCKFNELSIYIKHIKALRTLPHYHNDPFDRLLICQSIVEKIPLITKDKLIMKYGVSSLELLNANSDK